MKEKIYFLLPNFFQNTLITVFNILAYQKRYGGRYKYYLAEFKKNRTLSKMELQEIQKKRYSAFLDNSYHKSKYYNQVFSKIKDFKELENIEKLPILKKEILRSNIKNIQTISKAEGIASKTGGTTGKSLEVLFTKDNMQERFAMLDDFRAGVGYKLGKKTAWFSGKTLLNKRDLSKNRFWKTDHFYKVRYYSTFHVKNEYLIYYIENLIEFKPKFIVGFPSTILEIAKLGLEKGINFPVNTVMAIFPTAETITSEMRQIIESFFQSKIYNQYASSEGAPFVFECEKSNLHMDIQSGIFEVLDENNRSSNIGRLIVTSFTTDGTPLIRYDIGDMIEVSDEVCNCGNNNPLVKEIMGRIDDYLFSPENGKINLGNISNTLKDTKGIIKFQAVQNELNIIEIFLIIDNIIFNKTYENTFIKNWKDRFGKKMVIQLKYVTTISVEKSGKYRMIKNNIKHLI